MPGSLALRLKKIRKQRKWTQLMMADFLDLSRNTYSQYELDLRQPPIDRVMDMAARLGLSIDYLTGNSKFELTVELALQQGVLKRQRRVKHEDCKPYAVHTAVLPKVAEHVAAGSGQEYPVS